MRWQKGDGNTHGGVYIFGGLCPRPAAKCAKAAKETLTSDVLAEFARFGG